MPQAGISPEDAAAIGLGPQLIHYYKIVTERLVEVNLYSQSQQSVVHIVWYA